VAKQKFKVTNWSAYNKVLINRGSLIFWIDESTIQATQVKINMTITQRLFLVFSLLSASLISLVIIAVLVVMAFQLRFQYVQSNIVLSIIDLGKMVDASNQLIIWMYRHQSETEPTKQADVEKKLSELVSNLKNLNQYYLDNDISSGRDRQMTELGFATIQDIQNKLPTFLKGSREQNDAVSLRELHGNTGIGETARRLISGYMEQLQLNVDIGDTLKNQNIQIYQLTLLAMIAGSAIVITILVLFTMQTVVVNKNWPRL